MHKIFEENGKYITQQGLKYHLSNKKMDELETNLNAYLNLEMGIEGRKILIHILVFIAYILLAVYNEFTFPIGLAVSVLVPSVFYYIFDYLRLYKIPLFPLLIRFIEIYVFKFFIDKIIMLLLSIFVFDNILIFVCYIAGSFAKFIISFLSMTLGKNYILFTIKRELYYNNKIADYFIKLFK